MIKLHGQLFAITNLVGFVKSLVQDPANPDPMTFGALPGADVKLRTKAFALCGD